MSDDGGGTGKLRDEYGVLPPGDVRQCLVALSDAPEVRDLFSFRFGSGSLKNQTIGNIMLSGLELQHGCFEKAIEVASSILSIRGRVVPVTTEKHTLVMQDGDTLVRGESHISKHAVTSKTTTLTHEPPAHINPRATEAITDADLVVIAPGDHNSSILAALAVNGMAEAIAGSKAKIVAMTNLVTKPTQTHGWHVSDFAKSYEHYIGEGQLDYVLYNNRLPSSELLQRYAKEGELAVSTEPQRMKEIQAKAIGAALVANEVFIQDANDTIIKRTLIRHDAAEATRQLLKIYAG